MLAIAQANEFSIFIRKIGFSVGLEFTLDRIRDFANLYASKSELTYGDIYRLLHAPSPGGWGLDPNNSHVLDVFRSLNILSVTKGEVSVLEAGEALGILRRLQDDATFEKSLRFIFAHALVSADGDIFLNALSACFEPRDSCARITRMIEYKWSVLENQFSSEKHRRSIYSAVNIETQSNNPGSRGHGLAGRTGLETKELLTRRSGPLTKTAQRPEVTISDAYLRKALPRRKAWAASLGFLDQEGRQSPAGVHFLQTLALNGFGGPSCFAVWPTRNELATPLFIRFNVPREFPSSSWDFLTVVGHAMASVGTISCWKKSDQDSGVELMKSFLQQFRTLNQSKSVLRKELSARVAYRCALSWNIGRKLVPAYPEIIRHEQEAPSPRLRVRQSRYAEFAIS